MECVWCLFLMGHLQDQNRYRRKVSGCGHGLITVGGTAKHRMPAEAGIWGANEPGR